MIGARVDFQSFEHFAGQFVFWQHASNGVIDQVFGFSLLAIAVAFQPQSGVSGVPSVVPGVHFSSCHADFFRVHDHNKIATIDVRCVLRAMLTHQNNSDIACESTENFIAGINDEPLLFDLARFSLKS